MLAPTSKMVPSSTKPKVSVQRVGPQGASRERRRLLDGEAAGQRDRGDDRDETAQISTSTSPVATSQ